MKKLIVIFMLNLFFLTSCYAARVDGPYEGKIIDAETGQPIEGVVVLGTWSRETPTPGGAVHSFYDAQETVTDKNGEFKIKGLGLLVMSNVIPMDVLIFKAGHEHFGLGTWIELKKSEYLKQKKNIKWEGDRVIIPLKKLTIEERRRRIPSPHVPTEAPLKKVNLMLKEINKENIELGLGTIDIWGGEKIE